VVAAPGIGMVVLREMCSCGDVYFVLRLGPVRAPLASSLDFVIGSRVLGWPRIESGRDPIDRT
jgi:hypothetical protein